MITIMLVDDHPLFREGIRSRLQLSDEVELIGEAENGKEALDLLETVQPDIILMDINMPQMSGIDLLEVIAEKNITAKTIVLSMHNDREYIVRAIQMGAHGYMLKDISGDKMLQAIKHVDSGGKHFCQEVAERLAETDHGRSDHVLTNREQLILRLISLGYSNKQIAQELNNSVRTVETHRRNISQKLDIHTTSGLVRYAIEHRIDQ